MFLRILPREGGFALAVSAYACFPLTESGPRELLLEPEMWANLAKALGENDIFDPGYPKPRAEFLLYGRCFPKQETTGMDVSVRVGELYKSLQIMGGAQLERANAAVIRPLLKPVRLDWTQTYGGPQCEQNPLGKGHRPDKKIKELPAPSLAAS